MVSESLEGEPDHPHRPVTVERPGDLRTFCAISQPPQWEELADLRIARGMNPAIRRALRLVAAHEAICTDLFVTTDPDVLILRADGALRDQNIRTPLEASRIVGLLMRNRDHYQWSPTHGNWDRWVIYWSMTRGMLPSLWTYFSACVYSEKLRGDDITYLGQSVLTRAKYALEARDAIGVEFYKRQTNSTRDVSLYHLPYFALLLDGALDAQARVAHRAYQLPGPERRASFLKPGFDQQLAQAGATALANLIAPGSRFAAVAGLLSRLRNSIHGASYGQVAVGAHGGQPERSVFRVPQGDVAALRTALAATGEPMDAYGFEDIVGLCFEPFTLATKMCAEVFAQIDAVASATDVTRLFPASTPVPQLSGIPTNHEEFAPATFARLAVLG